jgi:hypothetical protein
MYKLMYNINLLVLFGHAFLHANSNTDTAHSLAEPPCCQLLRQTPCTDSMDDICHLARVMICTGRPWQRASSSHHWLDRPTVSGPKGFWCSLEWKTCGTRAKRLRQRMGRKTRSSVQELGEGPSPRAVGLRNAGSLGAGLGIAYRIRARRRQDVRLGLQPPSGKERKQDAMHPYSKRFILWTAVLVLFVAASILARFEWLKLIIPGAVLTWYGLAAPAPQKRVAVQKPDRSDLH